jgi:hypothetical protein
VTATDTAIALRLLGLLFAAKIDMPEGVAHAVLTPLVQRLA